MFCKISGALALIVLSAILPAQAQVTIDGSGAAGAPGSIGQDGRGYSSNDGSSGGNGGNGDAGETGGSVDQDIRDPVAGVEITSNGGDGGVGGKGGNGNAGLSPNWFFLPMDGGDGGNGGMGGNGGSGGNGGTVRLSIDATVDGDVNLSATGGRGGSAGSMGNGGDGGQGDNGGSAYSGGDGGRGGNGAVGGAGGRGGNSDSRFGGAGGNGGSSPYLTPGAGGSAGQSPWMSGPDGTPGLVQPFLDTAVRGADGQGGTISVTVNSAIGGDIVANAGTGSVDIVLNSAASVGGTISANSAADSRLSFNMDVSSRGDYDAAVTYLGDQANAMRGTISIDGRTFAWTGFDQLVQTLRFIGIESVTIVRASSSDDRDMSLASTSNMPAYLGCVPRAVTAFVKEGRVMVTTRAMGSSKSYFVGSVEAGVISNNASLGWSLNMERRGHLDVKNHLGELVSSCRI